MIGIINYGLGNVSAFENIYKKLGVEAGFVTQSADLAKVKKLILPGVGSFDYAMKLFNQSGLREDVSRLVLKEGVPVLGVCVGMQMMASSSEEGNEEGLGWIEGSVVKFDSSTLPIGSPLPHMGWNDLEIVKDDALLDGLSISRFYFLHSYYFAAKNRDNVIGLADYGNKFCCVVRSENIYGMQCHPEKSHSFGVQLLKNFASI